jgi:Co/Zn/Cd efflux system component
MNRLMRATLLAFVVSLVVWGLIAVWNADLSRRVTSWTLTWQRIAVDVAVVSGLVMLALLVYGAWERLRR